MGDFIRCCILCTFELVSLDSEHWRTVDWRSRCSSRRSYTQSLVPPRIVCWYIYIYKVTLYIVFSVIPSVFFWRDTGFFRLPSCCRMMYVDFPEKKIIIVFVCECVFIFEWMCDGSDLILPSATGRTTISKQSLEIFLEIIIIIKWVKHHIHSPRMSKQHLTVYSIWARMGLRCSYRSWLQPKLNTTHHLAKVVVNHRMKPHIEFKCIYLSIKIRLFAVARRKDNNSHSDGWISGPLANHSPLLFIIV